MTLHNIRKGHGYSETNVARIAEDLPFNVDLLEGIVEDEHHKREWCGDDFTLSGTAARGITGATGIQWPCVILADGSTGSVHGCCLRPIDWRSGNASLKVYYTSTLAGVALFNFDLRVWGVAENGLLTAVALHSATPQAPGPAVAQTQMTVSGVMAPMTPALSRLSWRVTRDGAADANNNALIILSVVLYYQPGKHEV